uniref:Macaca fascicularis brain cDNA, clone: QflA-18017 n=1 Tax=Macaca fascicularis TaxID=9541 RepID=I7GLF3_MACFA|nr:unnamed protein product [Macaca fascicularis]
MQARGVGLLWLEARRERWVVGGGDRREAWSGTRSSSAEARGGGGQIAFFLEPWAPHGQLECSEQLSPSGPLCRREVSRAGPVPLAHPSRGCTLDQSPNLSVPWKQGNGRATVLSGKVSLQHSCPLEPRNVTLFGNWVVADGIS